MATQKEPAKGETKDSVRLSTIEKLTVEINRADDAASDAAFHLRVAKALEKTARDDELKDSAIASFMEWTKKLRAAVTAARRLRAARAAARMS